MWPFSKNKKENSETKQETHEFEESSIDVLCRITNTYGVLGNYSTVQVGIYDVNEKNISFKDISRKFDDSESARNWMDTVLKADTEYGKRISKLLFVLNEQTEKYGVRWLYEYVLSMIEYYSSACVKDRSVLEVMLAVQMDDMGDEIFDCLYSTEMALFGKHLEQQYMSHVETDGTLLMFDKQQGFEPRTSEYGNGGRQFTHIGSNVKNLLGIHWKVNLSEIKV